jgi:hypothetical protein
MVPASLGKKALEHDPDPQGALAQSGYRFSLATNAKRLREDRAQTQE